MLFKKLLKRQEPVPVKVGTGSAVSENLARKSADHVLHERRRFPRPMPIPEVIEHDWDVWVNLTKDRTSKKSD
ncbi:hypothetical protein [Rhodoferax sp. U11-2br]|uniref:hypothetical protein n=1 Tax=Rhodoferax sp. U11-2br TaxID=2838878 RepID=UPI001BED3790|nr:hypothetical protein [Rhodoferax sp. U11-2br]MBT3067649.1 hypothetical protein [Rhodoferax sp. U11-2br]